MATKKKAPRQIGKVAKVTVVIALDMDEPTPDDYEVRNAVCTGTILDIDIQERPINEF